MLWVRMGQQLKSVEVARRVRAFRTQASMTQEQLARAAGVTPKFVSQLENDHVNVSIAVLHRVVEKGLGMPLALFFATDPADDVMGDVSTVLSLLAGRPPELRRTAIRLVRALVSD